MSTPTLSAEARALLWQRLRTLFQDAQRCADEERREKFRSSAPTPRHTLWRQLAEARYAATADVARMYGLDPYTDPDAS